MKPTEPVPSPEARAHAHARVRDALRQAGYSPVAASLKSIEFEMREYPWPGHPPVQVETLVEDILRNYSDVVSIKVLDVTTGTSWVLAEAPNEGEE
jgi:hypothetical protein